MTDSINHAAHVPGTDHPNRWSVLVVCCVGLFLLVSALSSLNVALPAIQRDLGASTSALQWIVDAYAVVFGGLLLTGGAVGDRIGRREALAGGFALMLAGGVLGGLAGSVTSLIVARVVAGLGAALMMPATLSVLTDVFAEQGRARAIAIWSGTAGAGGAIGPALSGWLLTVSTWPAVFWVNVLIAAVGLVGVWAVVPKLAPAASGRLDLLGTALSTLAIGTALYAIIAAPDGATEPLTVAAAMVAVGATVGFVWWQRTTPHPMLPLRVFDSPRLRAGVITLLLAAVGFAGVLFVAALLLQLGWRESALVTGLLLLPIGVSELAVSAFSPSVCRRFGVGPTVVGGLLAMAAGYVAMAMTPVGDRALFVAAGLLAGIGNGLVIPPSVERVVGGAEPSLAGVTAGVNETSIELGASLGVALLGGVQRVVFARNLPDGVPSTSVDAALADADTDVVLSAFQAGGRAGLIAAAIAALIAVPIAFRRHPGDVDVDVSAAAEPS
ncbi:MAG: MFS transporter [Actinomycetota bacterium]